jgi:hypothetical protein
MTALTHKLCSIALAMVSLLASGALGRPQAALALDWREYRNDRYGFSLQYPADLFVVERTAQAGDGQVFHSQIGNARLLVGAFVNDRGYSPASYQAYIARESYGGYAIEYQRLGRSWFVLSGDGEGKVFYEKVVFSCAGRLINSFALLYSMADRATFEPIIERIEDTFRSGKDCARIGLPDLAGERPPSIVRSPSVHAEERSSFADRIARSRGHNVFVILRRTSPPFDYRIVRGYASQPQGRD